jgi:hypothetical protein
MRTVLEKVAYEREIAMSYASCSPDVDFSRDVKRAMTIAHSSYLVLFSAATPLLSCACKFKLYKHCVLFVCATCCMKNSQSKVTITFQSQHYVG